MGPSTPLEAETMALDFGLQIAIKINCGKLIISTNFSKLAAIYNIGFDVDSNLAVLFRDLLQELGNP